MRRSLFNAVSGISAFLLVVVVAVWVVSYIWTVYLPLPTSVNAGVLLSWGRGRLQVSWVQNHPRGRMPPIEVRCPAHELGKGTLGFLVHWKTPTAASSLAVYSLRAPMWSFAIILVILPAVWFIRRKPPPGHCASCGYDMRASVGVCPECGRSIPPRA